MKKKKKKTLTQQNTAGTLWTPMEGEVVQQ